MTPAESRMRRLHELVSKLEEREQAAVAAASLRADRLSDCRAAVIRQNLRARRAVGEQTIWMHFDCACLWGHTVWASGVAGRFSALHAAELQHVSERDVHRMHWARCRVGVERRRSRSRASR
ncbi:MAG: hypothetical protein DLM53_07695 [Candidatus Eremiobacter antarcticus]|nr:hypothetical protein [Candidatus Eremiobacteraeota bacterium]PZR61848.1 MAG: hypothetical protein DLM53_07695 [Candidatus Eremiobacter sp. RRmetagenome_bin22]